MIEFPESAIQDIKVFVGKVSSDLVDVFLFVDLKKGIDKITTSDLATSDATRMTLVDAIKDASNDGDGVFFLELGMIAQKFQALEMQDGEELKSARVPNDPTSQASETKKV